MEKEVSPKTEIELEKWMKENCINFNNYSIGGNAIYEGFGIEKSGSLFAWYYTERGERNNLKHFGEEKEIIEYAYNQIKSDNWARTHCIGFTTDKILSLELQGTLDKMQVEFIEDKIPYYGLERPVYRTFVLGCDIHKTLHLKEKYYKEK